MLLTSSRYFHGPLLPHLHSTAHIAPLPAAQDKYLSTAKLRSKGVVSPRSLVVSRSPSYDGPTNRRVWDRDRHYSWKSLQSVKSRSLFNKQYISPPYKNHKIISTREESQMAHFKAYTLITFKINLETLPFSVSIAFSIKIYNKLEHHHLATSTYLWNRIQRVDWKERANVSKRGSGQIR